MSEVAHGKVKVLSGPTEVKSGGQNVGEESWRNGVANEGTDEADHDEVGQQSSWV